MRRGGRSAISRPEEIELTSLAHAAPPARRLSDAAVRSLAEALAAALSPDRVLTGEDVRRQHGTDESFHPPAAPDVVVFPLGVEEAARVVTVCAEHGAPIVPFGAGTSLEGHIAALHGGVSVDMSRMDKVLRLSIDDMDVTVQAGVTRTRLEERLRPEGVFFPVDPGADATIGGMVATGASGTTTVRYGAMRENVLSLLVVTADGSILRTRSRARKSSAGYDLTRLFIGSEGTLGLICEATLRVHPTPEAMAAATCAFPTLEAAVTCVMDVARNGIPVARIELADEALMDAINRYDGLDQAVAPTLFLEFHGGPADVEAQAAEVEAIARDHGAQGFARASEESERRRLWRARHRAYDAARALRPGSQGLTTDVCVPVSRLAECILQTQGDIEALGLPAGIIGHVGDGNFHVVVLVDPDDAGEVSRATAFHERLVRRALEQEGTCTGEHGIGYGKAAFLAEEHGAAGVAAMRAIKRALDPAGLFNPGKMADAAGP
jgi:D-lactate dehydrogenase (cytochrome)